MSGPAEKEVTVEADGVSLTAVHQGLMTAVFPGNDGIPHGNSSFDFRKGLKESFPSMDLRCSRQLGLTRMLISCSNELNVNQRPGATFVQEHI